MRMIVLDTETTGLEISLGHRIVEIGAVELVNLVPTGREYHCYFNPGQEIEAGAYETHGLTNEFLADHPTFAERVDEFLAFIGDDHLVIHNAAFDLAFLNMELTDAGRPPLDAGRAVDTLQLARARFPGAPASLDALCRRFAIDTAEREKHGARVDSRLLAEVYLHLCGGRQQSLDLGGPAAPGPAEAGGEAAGPRASRSWSASDAERAAHRELLRQIRDPVWLRD
ncbi:MAG: DNA polymerase III subunit epsilon [Alphaproteobacteria bacterium]|nr:DNA polymerase III subunit epsilon [Alphaproteobacteria bacterium]